MIEDQWIEWSGISVNVGIPMKAEKLSSTELKIISEIYRVNSSLQESSKRPATITNLPVTTASAHPQLQPV